MLAVVGVEAFADRCRRDGPLARSAWTSRTTEFDRDGLLPELGRVPVLKNRDHIPRRLARHHSADSGEVLVSDNCRYCLHSTVHCDSTKIGRASSATHHNFPWNSMRELPSMICGRAAIPRVLYLHAPVVDQHCERFYRIGFTRASRHRVHPRTSSRATV